MFDYCASKTLSYAIIVFINFLCGIEYAVILPTGLQYLESLNGDQFDLGLCLAAYSFSSLFSSPLLGLWSDRTYNTKIILLFSNLWQIFGSFMYFIGYNKWFLIGGRLVAGVGLGALAVCFSEVIKTTNQDNRMKILSRIMIGRQVGLIIGPSLNFLVLNLKFYVGPFYFNNLSAPGFLMTGLWLLLEIIIIIFYKNLREPEPINNNQNEVNESTRLLNSNQIDSVRINVVDNSQTGPLIVRLYNEYIREEVIAIFAVTFTVFFMQTSLETLLTPFTRDFLNWTDTQNSILFACASIEILIVFLLLSYLMKLISERYLLLIGLCGNLISLIYAIFYVPIHKNDEINIKKIIIFAIPVIINIFSLPFIALGSISILSKLTSIHSQGRTQGIRRSIVGIATILGPIWCGVLYGQFYFLFGSLIVIVLIPLCMLLFSFKWIVPLQATN